MRVCVDRFGTDRLYAQKEDLLHEVLELEAEKGLLASGESTKYQEEELRKRALEELSAPEQDKPNIISMQAVPPPGEKGELQPCPGIMLGLVCSCRATPCWLSHQSQS